jgi:hypothetical protein
VNTKAIPKKIVNCVHKKCNKITNKWKAVYFTMELTRFLFNIRELPDSFIVDITTTTTTLAIKITPFQTINKSPNMKQIYITIIMHRICCYSAPLMNYKL